MSGSPRRGFQSLMTLLRFVIASVARQSIFFVDVYEKKKMDCRPSASLRTGFASLLAMTGKAKVIMFKDVP